MILWSKSFDFYQQQQLQMLPDVKAQFGLRKVKETFSNISFAKARLIQLSFFNHYLIVLNVILEPIWEATMTGMPTMVQLNPSRAHEEEMILQGAQDKEFINKTENLSV